MNLRLAPVFAAATLLVMPLASHALVYQFNAALMASNEVGTPSTATATGLASLFYDDKGTLGLGDDTYDFTMFASGLSGGPSGTAASGFHIHGAATTTENAPVRVFLDTSPSFSRLNSGSILMVGGSGVAAPVSIAATPATGSNAGHPAMSFLAMLQGGLAYVNVHTTANPGGAIRGQLIQVAVVPEPATYGMMALGLLGVGLVARRRRNA